MRETYRVPGENLDELKTRIERLNKRAARLGVDGITTDTVFVETVRFLEGPRRADGSFPTVPATPENRARLTDWTERARDWYDVTIEGEAPRFGGWELAGTLMVEEGGVILRNVPGMELPHEFRDADRAFDCDHCNRAIPRNVTHVVRNEETGDWCRVGSTCIKDFLGHKNPHALARWAELLGAFASDLGSIRDPGWGGGGREAERWPLDTFLTWVQAVSRRAGWVSRSRARNEGGEATVDTVLFMLSPCPFNRYTAEAWRVNRARFAPEDQDREFVEAAIEWAETEWLNRDPSNLNDYEHNMSVALRSDSVGAGTAGIVGSLSAAYYRHTQAEERKERRAAASPVPAGDGRVEVEGVIIKLDVKDNGYGTREVMTVRVDDGWTVWGTVPRDLYEANVGDRVRFTARLDRSDNDDTFGFFKRPTKAEIVERATEEES